MAARDDTDRWLAAVYQAADRSQLNTLYDQWADSYDADLQAVGYVHQPVVTGLVCRHVADRGTAILDAGVGTGAFGTLLQILGYHNLSGLDMSDGMLAKAAARGCYRHLTRAILGEALPYDNGAFGCILSAGTFTLGHAPASALIELTRLLRPGGTLIVTIGEPIYQALGFASTLEGLCAARQLRPVESTPPYSPMPHSPAEHGYLTRAHVYARC